MARSLLRKGDLWFLCPACRDLERAARSGEESIFDGTNRVPIEGPGKWDWNGDLERPTLKPSLLTRYGTKDTSVVCHSFITDGRIQYLGDCTHPMAGMTVDLPEFPKECFDDG